MLVCRRTTREPLPITTRVCTLLTICLNVDIELKKFRNEATEVRTAVTAMLADVKTLRTVLETMEETSDDMDNEPPVTGAHCDTPEEPAS